MAMFSKGRGLFGAPMAGASPAYTSASPDAAPIQQAATVPTYKKPSTANLVIGTIGDTLSQIGGGQGHYLEGLQQRQALAGQQAQYQQRRADEYADWEKKQAYEAAHPKPLAPDNFTQTLAAAGIDPASPQGRALYQQRAATLASPAPNFVSDGAGGGRWVTPPAVSLLPSGPGPTAPVGRLTPLGAGGATPQGARTFPVR